MKRKTGTPAKIEELPPPVTGPQAWYGPDLAKSEQWVYHLDGRGCGRNRGGG